MQRLCSAGALRKFAIRASDGELGTVQDLLFDDQDWTIRYLVVDTGGWLTGRQVLISPIAVKAVDWHGQAVQVALSREEVESSPDLDTQQPVSRQRESEFYRYYGYPDYWSGPYLWGYAALPSLILPLTLEAQSQPVSDMGEQASQDPHLRSAKEVQGYAIQASDDTVGHVEDFLFAPDSWQILLLVIDTRNWWPGKHVMVAPGRIREVSWNSGSVVLDIARQEVEASPEYDAAAPPTSQAVGEIYRPFSPTGGKV